MGKRESIVKRLHVGKPIKQIAKAVSVTISTVYHFKRYLKERGTVDRKPQSGRRATVVTKRLINLVQNRVIRNPMRSMRMIARETGVLDYSIRKAVRKLGARSLVRTSKFLLTDCLKMLRLNRCKQILNLLKMKAPVILYTDEKFFFRHQLSPTAAPAGTSQKSMSGTSQPM